MNPKHKLYIDQYGGPAIVVFLILLAQLLNPEFMAYNREAILSGSIWQPLTANFLHLNGTHLTLNFLGLVCLVYVHQEHYALLSYLAAVLIISICTTLGLLVMSPDVTGYVGLSGVLHGLLAWGIAYDLQKRRQLAWLLAFILLGKLSYEAIHPEGGATSELISAPVISAAHLYGAVGGMIAYMLDEWFRKRPETE